MRFVRDDLRERTEQAFNLAVRVALRCATFGDEEAVAAVFPARPEFDGKGLNISDTSIRFLNIFYVYSNGYAKRIIAHEKLYHQYVTEAPESWGDGAGPA